jgi:phage terminase Nu1 subunit (DNA packaging protein)
MTKRTQTPLPDIVVGRSELARILGLTGSRISQLVREGVLPAPTGRGQFPLIECVSRYVVYQREGTGGDRMKHAGEFSQARAEWMRSKARKAALEEKVLSDQWIPVAVMTEAWCAIGAIMRTRYLGVPSLLAARHATLDSPQKLFDCAMNLINESLEEIQKLDLKDLPIKWEGEPDDEAA